MLLDRRRMPRRGVGRLASGTVRPWTAGWRCRPSRVLLRSGSVPVAANARTLGRTRPPALSTGRPVVHRSTTRGPGTRPGRRRCPGDRRPADPHRRPARRPRLDRVRRRAGASTSRSRPTTHDRLRDVLPALGAVARAAGAGPVGRLVPAGRRPSAQLAPELRPRRGPGPGRPGAAGDRRAAVRARWNCGWSAARTPVAPSRSGRARHVLGRGGDVAVRLDDPDVSRRHVAVQVGGGSITVADLGSTNGSRLGRRRTSTAARGRGRPARCCVSAPVRSPLAGPGGAARGRSEPAPGGRLRRAPAAPDDGARDRDARSRFPRPPARTAAPPAGLGGGGAARGRAACSWRWLLHTPTFLFFAAAQPGGRPGHVAVRALVGPAQRTPRSRGARCSRRSLARRAAVAERWPPTSGPRTRRTRTWPRWSPRPGGAPTCCGAGPRRRRRAHRAGGLRTRARHG